MSREGVVHHLEQVERGGQHRVGRKHASLDQEGNLQVGESSTLPIRAPWRFTATLPHTMMSTDGSSLAATLAPPLSGSAR